MAVEELVLEETSKQNQENVLAALLSRPQRLSLATVWASQLSPTAISFLAGFQSLSICCLTHKRTDQPLDLSPLQGLQHLAELELSGIGANPHYVGVHSLARVTS